MFKVLRENAKIVIISAVTSLIFSAGGVAIAGAYITGADIQDETITNMDIANHTIGYKKLRSSSVNTYKIANYSIQGIDVENRSIPLNKLTSNVALRSHSHGTTSHTHSYASTSHNHDSDYYLWWEVNDLIDSLEAYHDARIDILWDVIDIYHPLFVASTEVQALKNKAEALRKPTRPAK